MALAAQTPRRSRGASEPCGTQLPPRLCAGYPNNSKSLKQDERQTDPTGAFYFKTGGPHTEAISATSTRRPPERISTKGFADSQGAEGSPRDAREGKTHGSRNRSCGVPCKTNPGFLSKSYLQANCQDPISPASETELQRQRGARAVNAHPQGIKPMGKLCCQTRAPG